MKQIIKRIGRWLETAMGYGLVAMTDLHERPTGIIYQIYRTDVDWDDDYLAHPHGQYETRHDAIGMAARFERILGGEFGVTWHESLWRKVDEPAVCDYCGFEEYYRPLVRWTFATDVDKRFCTTECFARWDWENDRIYHTPNHPSEAR